MNGPSPELRDWINSKVLEYIPRDRVVQGDKIVFRCPVCGDSKRNSLKKRGYYYTRTASYHCFNCDVSMGGMKFLEFLSGEDYGTLRKEYFQMTFDGKHFSSASGSGKCAQSASSRSPKFRRFTELTPMGSPMPRL